MIKKTITRLGATLAVMPLVAAAAGGGIMLTPSGSPVTLSVAFPVVVSAISSATFVARDVQSIEFSSAKNVNVGAITITTDQPMKYLTIKSPGGNGPVATSDDPTAATLSLTLADPSMSKCPDCNVTGNSGADVYMTSEDDVKQFTAGVLAQNTSDKVAAGLYTVDFEVQLASE